MVLDSSAVIDYLLGSGVAADVQQLLDGEDELAAPDVLTFEVLAVLRREVTRGLDEWRASRAVLDLADMALALFSSVVLRERAWALRRNFTIGDALFIALAEQLSEPLATKDAALAEEAPKHADLHVVLLRDKR